MTLLTTREALASELHAMRVVESKHPQDRTQPCRYCFNMADRLLAARAVVDAATLADDEALVKVAARAVLHRWPVDEPIHEEDREQIRHAFRALAAALSEPVETREAAR